MHDIEENTNFLIAKRKSRLKKSKNEREKYLYHTINEGYLRGGIKYADGDNHTP